jgi:hypothetical protein
MAMERAQQHPPRTEVSPELTARSRLPDVTLSLSKGERS